MPRPSHGYAPRPLSGSQGQAGPFPGARRRGNHRSCAAGRQWPAPRSLALVVGADATRPNPQRGGGGARHDVARIPRMVRRMTFVHGRIFPNRNIKNAGNARRRFYRSSRGNGFIDSIFRARFPGSTACAVSRVNGCIGSISRVRFSSSTAWDIRPSPTSRKLGGGLEKSASHGFLGKSILVAG